MPTPVLLDRCAPPHGVDLAEIADLAADVDGRADRSLDLALLLGRRAPQPGGGRTRERWELLATAAAADLTAGRVAEAHLDALAILAEAGIALAAPELTAIGVRPDSTWGVFAAEGPGHRLAAEETGSRADGIGWRLFGSKPWCSLADRLSHALITAHTPGGRRLFAINLRDGRVRAGDGDWAARGLADVPSGPIVVEGAPAIPVGADHWYLERPGFAWGGMGVAACWIGGAIGLGRTLYGKAAAKEPDQIGLMHLGAVDAELQGALGQLRGAAAVVDGGGAVGAQGALLALRTRTVVADAAEDVIRRVGHALGPAPLAQDEEHARRVADLEIYLRQHHAERDQAALGRSLLDGELPW